MYDLYAPWYDLQNDMDDIEFYLDAAQEYGGPVLDAGCGTGRILLPMAREGVTAYGIDISQEMLQVARDKAAGESPEVQANLKIAFGDIRQYQLDQRFGVLLFGCNTFQHLLTNDEQDQALQCARNHLEDHGRLFLQATHVRFHEHEPDVLYHRGREYNPRTAEQADVSYVYHYFHHLQIQQFTLLLDITRPDGLLQRRQVVLNLRYMAPPEIERLLAANGFVLEAMYGDFQRNPVHRDSPWIIVQARKR